MHILLIENSFLNHFPMKHAVVCQSLGKFSMFTFKMFHIQYVSWYFFRKETEPDFGFYSEGIRKIGEFFKMFGELI